MQQVRSSAIPHPALAERLCEQIYFWLTDPCPPWQPQQELTGGMTWKEPTAMLRVSPLTHSPLLKSSAATSI